MRLLRVLAEQDDHRIRIELWETEDAVPYRCLSYTWGNSTAKLLILVNGQLKDVGENLYDFLEMASRRFVGETLWIDALCINQADDLEKSAQVQRMGSIYKEAVEVLIWLGNDPGIADLFDWTHRKVSMWNKITYCSPIDRIPTHLRDGRKMLARHGYWNRTWIVQEVVLARSLRILCKTSETTPEKIKRYHSRYLADTQLRLLRTRKYQTTVLRFEPLFHRTFELYSVLTLLMGNQKKEGHEFWEVFNPHSECIDPRDRIYGILAITNQGAEFKIDYREDVIDLFWRAGEFFSAWQSVWHALDLISALGLNYQLEAVQEALADPNRKAIRCSVHLRVRNATARTKLSRHKSCRADHSDPVEVENCGEHDLLLCSWDERHSKYSGHGRYISHRHQSHYVLRQERDSALSLTITMRGLWKQSITHGLPQELKLWHVVEGTEREVTTWADITGTVSSENGQVSGMTEGQVYILYFPFSHLLEDFLALSHP